LPSEPHYEKRYPYLDRDLLEFLFAVPREQLVRPGQRRSLMRRALVGIVPDEILNRKRKAYVARSSNTAIVADWATLSRKNQQLVCEALGIVSTKEFANAVEKIRQGHDLSIVPLFRTLAIEAWLSQFAQRRSFRLTDGHAPEALAYTRSSLSG
jgi:asparagine synthase (glutamine-hydrolysing)